MANPILLAKRCSVEEFLAEYDPEATPFFRSPSTRQTVLFGALANRDPAVRVVIANRLLDDGADPSVVTITGVTLLHVLLTHREFDVPGDAALLQRLLDGGADVNRADRREGAPLAMLYRMPLGDEELVPFYEVMFARDDLDLDKPAAKGATVRETVLGNGGYIRPRMQDFVRAYDAAHRAPTPGDQPR